MVDYLGKYGYAPDSEAMGRSLEMVAANLESIASEQVYKECFSMMDLTTLKTNDTPASVTKLVNKVNDFQQSRQGFWIFVYGCVIAVQLKIINIFIGIIQDGVEVAAKIHQIIVNGHQLLLQLATHLAGSIGGGIGGVRFDQIDHRFGLGQIQMAVQKSPLGKFAPLGRLCSGDVQAFQGSGKNGRGAVAVKFHRILAGVAVGIPGNDGAARVDDAAALIVQSAKTQLFLGSKRQGSAAV